MIDLKDYEIVNTFDYISQILNSVWKQRIKNKTLEIALKHLNSNQGSNILQYSELKMVNYLCPSNEEIHPDIAKFIIRIQCHMIEEVKYNWKNKYGTNLNCDNCENSECTQKHLLECPVLVRQNTLISYIHNYSDVFGNDIQEQVYDATIIRENLRLRIQVKL